MDNISFHNDQEYQEFQAIIKWFPEAKLKRDYNREILCIGVQIPWNDTYFTLLKGPQTNDCYELITPDCKWFEGLEEMEQVFTLFQRICRESS